MRRGRLITIEGIDGAGKTTLAQSLAAELGSRGIDVRLLREPGGAQISERIRELVKDPALTVGPRTEALLYAAARAQLVEQTLRPLLEEGRWVLLDRFVDSSLAYQGAGRGLGVGAIKAINDFATGELVPDRTLLLAVDPEIGKARITGRPEPPDRLEQEEHGFHARTASAYRELAAADPSRIRVIEAGVDPRQVLDAALGAIADLL
ncbi:MAG: dTMP kinase [Solirubrobacterales bacterium]|nr:dTMP kinase [Solirubrobacterales bacterium]